MYQDSLFVPRPAWTAEALQVLARHRVATGRQLAAALGLDVTAATPGLDALVREGVLQTLLPTTLALRVPSEPAYALTRAGYACLDDEVRPQRFHALRSAFTVAHELVVAEFAIVFERLHRAGHLRLLSFHTARERIADVTHLAEGRSVVRVPLVADALAIVEVGHRPTGLLVEVDMGTVSASTMRRKYAGYTAWWEEGGPVRRFGLTATRVVSVAPTTRRLTRLRELAIEATDGRGTGLLWFLPQSALDVTAPEKLFEAVAMTGKAADDRPRPLLAA